MGRKLLAGLLIIMGLIFIFSDQINDLYLKYQSQEVTEEVKGVTVQEMHENNVRELPAQVEEEMFDFSQVKPISVEESWTSLFQRNLEDPEFAAAWEAEQGDSKTVPKGTDTATKGTDTAPKGTDTVPKGTDTAPKGADTAPKGADSVPKGQETTKGTVPKGDNGVPGQSRAEEPDQGSGADTNGPPAPISEEEAREALKKFTRRYYIGMLKIPDINLELGILKGVRNKNLWRGSGTMRKDQVMGERNYPIAGHHMRAWEVLFNRVPELQRGDLIYITDKEYIYTYRVYQNRKVHQSAIQVIYDQVAVEHGSPVLTLVTCFHRNEPEARVIIHGELIDTKPYTDSAFNSLG